MESAADIPFEDNADVGEYLRAQKVMRPFVVWKHPDKPGHWQAAATIYYGRDLFHAIFEVPPTGLPKMQNDRPKATNLKASLLRVSDRETGVKLDGESAGQTISFGRLNLIRHATDVGRMATVIKRSVQLSPTEGAALRRDFVAPILEPEFDDIPSDPHSARNSIAYHFLVADVDPELALQISQMAVNVRPDNPYMADTLGWALLKNGHLDEAVMALERAVAGVQTQAEIRAHLAQAYRLVGRKDDALAQIKTGLALAPSAFWTKFLEKEQALIKME